jgi:hypothetical protein
MVNTKVTKDTASHSRKIHNAFVPADYIKPCSRNDPKFNDCALKHGRDAIPRIVRGNLYNCTQKTSEIQLMSILLIILLHIIFFATCSGSSRSSSGRANA